MESCSIADFGFNCIEYLVLVAQRIDRYTSSINPLYPVRDIGKIF
jgi:hypothetical protein